MYEYLGIARTLELMQCSADTGTIKVNVGFASVSGIESFPHVRLLKVHVMQPTDQGISFGLWAGLQDHVPSHVAFE